MCSQPHVYSASIEVNISWGRREKENGTAKKYTVKTVLLPLSSFTVSIMYMCALQWNAVSELFALH